MSTPKQLQASRANGARSKGPVTPQGKINSSRNSTRHGLFAKTIVLEVEQKDQFIELIEGLFEEHQPTTPTEIMLVDTIAAARWRQDRIWGMQKVAFDDDVASSTSSIDSNPLRALKALRASPENVRTHELLLRYEIALDRQISRALLRLHQLQDRALPANDSQRTQPAEEPIAPQPGKAEKSAPQERTHQALETTPGGQAPGPQPDPSPASPPPVSSPKVLLAPTRRSKGAKTASSKQDHPEKRRA